MTSEARPNHVQLNPLLENDEEARSYSCLNEENNCLDATLKFISDMLMEEDDLETTPYMLHDSLALLATQKSLHAVLNKHDDNDEPPGEGDSPNKADPEDLYDNVLLSSGTNQLKKTYTEHAKRGRVKIKNGTKKLEPVDLRSLLTTCAQAVSNLDSKTATHLLQQIRPHSSPRGDSLQRVAHCLANALEARLHGTGTAMYAALNSKPRSASEVLKAHRMCITACPFRKMSILLANEAIEKLAAGKTALHIVDFGILYGFQWPHLIQNLSERRGGPPRLRITGIELPQKGESPAEETGRRLAKYCERFGVPFEYNAIDRIWESVRVEDLKIRKGELLVVNSQYRFQNLLDETVTDNNPRDAVLKLIRESEPAMFIHGVSNGQYSAPFFTTRFSEAMFHFSNMFDMMDATVPQEDEDRLIFEEIMLGKMAMNVIACEGTERVERPETYKHWRIRMKKAGFRQVPLDEGVVRHVRSTVRNEYHKDFYVDEDGKWLLLGWKGRVNEAVSCWKPAAHKN